MKTLGCGIPFLTLSKVLALRLLPYLKTRATIGNCQRLVFSLGVSQHMFRITNMWKFEISWLSKLRDINERENTLVTQSCVHLDGWFRGLKFWIWGLKIKFVENDFFLENYVTSEGAVSHNVVCHQPLPITRYQVRYANNYFE